MSDVWGDRRKASTRDYQPITALLAQGQVLPTFLALASHIVAQPALTGGLLAKNLRLPWLMNAISGTSGLAIPTFRAEFGIND